MLLTRIQKSELIASLLSSGWTVRVQVSGWSMKPLVVSGGFLHIAPIEEPLRIGEIALCRGDDGKFTTHRVHFRTADTVLTKGDACTRFDGPLRLDQILGRVVRIEGPLSIPTDNGFSRWLGLRMSHLYPRLVKLKSTLGRWLAQTTPQGATRV